MFINNYKPQVLENIIGNSAIIKSIIKWFDEWYITQRDIKNTCALISGSTGIGKTLTIELLIQKYNLNPIMLNPDEKADKEYIANSVIPSIKKTKSFTNKQNIFVIHDIDCYDDYGFISSVVACLKETKIPVIATCNNRYDQALKPLTTYCLDFKFQKPSCNDIAKFIKPILKKENIDITDARLNEIIEDSNNDVRSILNNLEFYYINNKNNKINNSNNNNNENKSFKDKTISNIFEVTKLFMSQNTELYDKQTLFWMNNDILPLMIHENYIMNNIKMKNEALHLKNISDSMQSLSDIDLLDKNIHIHGNWELLPYVALNSIKAVANCHPKAQINFTTFFQKNAFKSKKIKNNMGDIIVNPIVKVKSKTKTPPKTKEPKKIKTKTEPKEPKTKEVKTTKKTKEVEQKTDPPTEKPKIVRKKKYNLIIEE
jgi:replication factor C subunit 1